MATATTSFIQYGYCLTRSLPLREYYRPATEALSAQPALSQRLPFHSNQPAPEIDDPYLSAISSLPFPAQPLLRMSLT